MQLSTKKQPALGLNHLSKLSLKTCMNTLPVKLRSIELLD